MDENIDYKSIAMAHRAIMSRVWQRMHADPDGLSDEERLLGEQMLEHENYHEIWENIDNLSGHAFDPAREENPFLHVSLHVTLERQIRDEEPPFVKRTFERLTARGDDPHAAKHAILRVLVKEMWGIMSSGREFDIQRYRKGLESL